MVPDEFTPLSHSFSADPSTTPSRTRERVLRRYTATGSSAHFRVKDYDDDDRLGEDRFAYGETDLAQEDLGEETTPEELSAEEREERTRVGKLFGFGRKPGSKRRYVLCKLLLRPM